jgi:hypothetical protein
VGLVYRQKNVEDLRAIGVPRVALIRSAFVPEVDHPMFLTKEDIDRFCSDVVYVGHFERDSRLDFLQALDASGVRLRIFGPDWDRAPRREWLKKYYPIRPLVGEDYRKAIAGSKISICFLSTLNHDTYTRRCFEIPAIGGFLLCQRSRDMEGLFRSGREAAFFSSADELVLQTHLYLGNSALRERIAQAGLRAVWDGGHDIVSRMREVERIIVDEVEKRDHAH